MNTSTKDKLKQSAITLFAEKGFAATTVGDIENGAGLSPRAGGFYRHFSSKMAMLETLIDEAEVLIFSEFESGLRLPLGDTKSEMILIANMILHVGEKYRHLRILLRSESKLLPEFAAKMGKINVRLVDEYLIPWLRSKDLPAQFAGMSEAEVIQVIFGSIFYFMIGRDVSEQPYGVSQQSFVLNWANLWSGMLR